MEATATASATRVADDRRPDPARGRSAIARPHRRSATSATAPGTTSRYARARRDRRRRSALGLIDLGIEPGERVCILANTRPEWSYADMAATSAGAVVVPIYQTNSPEECLWVISDSDACAIVCEDDAAAREDRRDPRPAAATCARSSSIDRRRRRGDGGDARGRRARARSRWTRSASADAHARAEELEARRAAVKPGGPVHVHLHLRHDRPAEGLRAHARQLPRDRRHGRRGAARSQRRRGHLPLPAARALLRAADPARRVRPRRHARLLRRRHQADRRASCWRSNRPTCRRCRASSRRSTRSPTARSRRSRPRSRRGREARSSSACKVRDMISSRRGRSRTELQEPFEEADEQLFKNVRAIFGGACATPPAAPRRSRKEILEFFWACGVPVLEGYGMTETATAATASHASRTTASAPSGAPLPGRRAEDRRRRRDPDQGPEHLPRLPQQAPTRASARSRTAGCTPATSARSTRTATSRSPAARRTSSSPPAARTSRRRTSRTTSSSAAGSPRRSCTATSAPTRSC